MSTKTDELSKILKDNFHRFVLLEGNSRYVNVPTFDLYPRDYLGYAENGITNGDTKKLIECVGHLKRAVDCQIDVFLSVFGFSKYFKKWKLGVDKKLDFLYATGVFDSRTLTRLNTIRNRMEHRYEIPKIKDVEIYYDLVSAFISILEGSILLLRYNELVFVNEIDKHGNVVDIYESDEHLIIEYDFEKPSIAINYSNLPERSKKNKIRVKEKKKQNPNDASLFQGADYEAWFKNSGGIKLNWDATFSNDYRDFAYYFRVYNLLSQKDAFASDKYILARL